MAKIPTVNFPKYSESTHRTIEVKGQYVWTDVGHESPDTVKIVRDFGLVDNKGRDVGAYVKTFTEVYRDATPEEIAAGEAREYDPGMRVYRIPAGTYYCFTPYATRDSAHFGASNTANTYHTQTARDAAVAEYFKRAQKRAIKAWAPK